MDNMQKIPVFFTFDANYLLAAKVAIHSMMKHASQQYWYELYVFHTTLSPKAQQSLRNSLKEFTHTELHFIDVTQYNEKIKNFGTKAHYSKEIFYKLIATDVLPQYDRIICSDVGVVFTGDFSPVFFMFPNEKFYYAGVGPVENSRMPYYRKDFSTTEMEILEHEIAAGFLLINLKELRNDHKQEEIINFYVNNYPRLRLPEQDCIILTCWPYIKYLPIDYSLPISFYRLNMNQRDFYQGNTEFAGDKATALAKFNKGLAHPVQIHYAGFDKPWNCFRLTRRQDWIKAMKSTPGGMVLYLKSLPRNLLMRTKRYSLKRFLRKTYKRITNR